MEYELHKNAIITGSVNHFCLVCDTFLEKIQDAFSHIESSDHYENLNLIPYAHQYKDHEIRKLKSGYFCAFCNLILPTAIKVDLHITEEDHKQKRGNTLLKVLDHKIIAFNNVLIKDIAWHGLKDNVCSLCDCEFEDINQHKSEISHVLNLIQKPVKFGANDSIYRHIDDATIQCLTCDSIVYLIAINTHFKSADHIDIYANCKPDEVPKHIVIDTNHHKDSTGIKSIQNSNKEELENQDNGSHAVNYNDTEHEIIDTDLYNLNRNDNYLADVKENLNSKSVHSLSENIPELVHFDSDSDGLDNFNSFPIDSDKSDSASPNIIDIPSQVEKSDKGSYNIQFNNGNEQIKSSHIAEKNDRSTASVTPKCTSDEAFKIAKDNDITYNAKNADAFCRICQVKVPASLNSLKEHINGYNHNKIRSISNQVQKINLRKYKTKYFLRKLDSISNILSCNFVINRKYFISDLSFFLMTETENIHEFECFLCKMCVSYMPLYYKVTVESHYLMRHVKCFKNIPVVTSVASEFIREIRQEEFHCGHCNIVIMGWREMESHLESYNHKNRKFISQIQLNEFDLKIM